MGRSTWNAIKLSKDFYVKTYRWLLTSVLVSLCVNTVLILAVGYFFLQRNEEEFYASDGITAPILLTSLATPNFSGEALLPPDPVDQNDTKVIPE